MDLLSIIHTLWRYKLIVLPVIVLTAIAGLYVVKIKPPVYEASSSILLANPEVQATQSQIDANPGLRKASPYNTFVSYGDLSVVANAVMDLATSASAQPALINSGVNPRYQLTLSSDYGNPPIIEITGVGPNAQEAIRSATVLTAALKDDLYQLQAKEGIDPFYMVTAIQLVKPTQAQRSTSGKLRSIVAVLALGVLLIFVVVSVADALEKRRRGSLNKTNTRTSLQGIPQVYRGAIGSESEPVLIDGPRSRRALARRPLD
jgi:uncharacterized protein involved in exopolysaccharide biosynthesis